MPLQETSGNATTDAYGGGVAAVPQYIEDVFSTYLWDGNNTARSITNGIDLAGKGGMVWIKSRNGAFPTASFTTNQTPNYRLNLPTTQAQLFTSETLTAFNSDGFSLGTDTSLAYVNYTGYNYVGWTFRKQPKFFDVVTWTGDDAANRQISHSLGSVPGCIIVKRTDASATWRVWHQNMVSNPANLYQYQLNLNTTDAVNLTYGEVWGTSNNVTSTTFQVGSLAAVNGSGGTYVAYVFAHNAGGFGLTGTDNVISCGSYTGNGSTTGPTVTLGYEPQWVLIKEASASGNQWVLFDNMRGMPVGSNDNYLFPNLSSAESSAYDLITPTATGFSLAQSLGIVNASGSTYIYIAIRRGPMKVPTSGTDVFQPASFTSTASRQTMGSLPVVDMFMGRRTNSIKDWGNASRLTGNYMLKPNLTDAQDTNVTGYGDSVLFDLQNGSSMITSGSGDPFITYNLHRAPSFFDEVCYTGNGGSNTITHNLGVAPELIIFKSRSTTENWVVFTDFGPIYFRRAYLDLTNSAPQFGYGGSLLDSAPTATTISLLSGTGTNSNTTTYLAYLFATCAGVSKVGTYTGTGTTLQINCGFTAGARFVLIKRADSTGDWYVWDSARGIVAGNDPYLLLNSTAAEVTSTDYVDTYSAGFEISSTAPAAINASGGTFIFLAIA
jgi:hypothetical protein